MFFLNQISVQAAPHPVELAQNGREVQRSAVQRHGMALKVQ